jgi:hypothetical protein
VPVTTTRTVEFTSVPVNTYVDCVAATMSPQFEPAESQRCH